MKLEILAGAQSLPLPQWVWLKAGMSPNRANAGQVTQQSADNGIDGIINEDPLGLDTIYLQAKRWQDPVGEGPIRDFIGALVIKGVKKGVFLTTSYFTPAARAAVQGNKSDQKIVLIDGARLAALMIEHNLGVSTAQTFGHKLFHRGLKPLPWADRGGSARVANVATQWR